MSIESENKERHIAFQACALEEQPKLTNIKSVIAQEYFNHGWDAAMAHSNREIRDSAKKYSTDDFTQTNVQKAVIMGTSGTPSQQQEARAFLRVFLNRN